MNIRILFLFIVLSVHNLMAQQLSDEAEISILTIGPGASLNDAFGHNVFRIYDPVNNIDVGYDYGRFPFNDPGFYLNFARGKLNYSIGLSPYQDVKGLYVWQNRTIKEQVLNLTSEEKQAVYNYLKNNYKPGNRDYLYDFFFDNCATKIKDVLQNTLNSNLKFNEPENFEPVSFRTLIQQNLNYNSWGSVGIDIALGSVIDKTATAEEHMFLPKYIHEFFSTATLGNQENKLVKSQRTLYQEKETDTHSNVFVSPLVVFSLISLLIICFTFFDFKKNKRTRFLDTLLFLITGIIGLFLLLLWFATDHTATAQNYNLLWAFPLNIILVWGLKNPKPWVIKLLKFLLIMICLMVFHWLVGIQVFAKALIPLVVAISVRYVFLIYYFKKQTLP